MTDEAKYTYPTLTPEQREAARNLAEKWLAQHAAQYPNAHPDDPCSICTLSRALLDAEADVAAMAEWAAKVPHAEHCESQGDNKAPHAGVWIPHHEPMPERCNCYLATLSDSIARGRELLEKEAKLELASEFELDRDITVCRCRQRGGSIMWAVRRAGFCLAKDGEWEWEPLPSSRDGEFLSRCRFSSYEEAASSLAKLKGESNA